MRICPIKNTNTNNHSCKNLNFTAHPDFYKFNSTQSCYFRRGVVALANKKVYSVKFLNLTIKNLKKC